MYTIRHIIYTLCRKGTGINEICLEKFVSNLGSLKGVLLCAGG
jgi:hypothetical protein